MKVSSLLGLLLISMVCIASAFTPPNGKPYGVTTGGTYWVAKNLVVGVDGQTPKLMTAADNWQRHTMTLEGDYYVVRALQVPLMGMSADFCIDVGGNRYIPHALQSISDQSLLSGVNPNDIVDNGVGGYNFHTKPVVGK